jgi:hypothetical protein
VAPERLAFLKSTPFGAAPGKRLQEIYKAAERRQRLCGNVHLALEKNARNFTVTGDFEGAALVKAFNKAGFYVKVKKDDN